MLMICKKGFGKVIIAKLAAIIGAIINMISAITLIIPRARLSMEFLVFLVRLFKYSAKLRGSHNEVPGCRRK